jgi:hypothetical protein
MVRNNTDNANRAAASASGNDIAAVAINNRLSICSLRGSDSFRVRKNPGHPGGRLADHFHYIANLHDFE